MIPQRSVPLGKFGISQWASPLLQVVPDYSQLQEAEQEPRRALNKGLCKS